MNQPAQQQTKTSPIAEFRRDWDRNKVEVARQLPKGVDPDRFMRTTITTVQANPDLLDADRSSLFTACMQAAKDGLLPDGREATIQVYNTNIGTRDRPRWVKQAQYMPMVRGLIKKMYEAGCTKVDGVAVYEKDEFVFELGDDPKITHKPYLGVEDPGLVIASYAIVKLENGEIKREVMPRRDIEKVREASKSSNGPGWNNWYDQFAIKAVLKRIYKQVPGRSDEFEAVAEADNAALGITFEHTIPDEVLPALEQNTASARLKDRLRGQQAEPEPEPAKEEVTATDDSGAPVSVEEIPGVKKASDLKPPVGKKKPQDQSTKEFVKDLEGGKGEK